MLLLVVCRRLMLSLLWRTTQLSGSFSFRIPGWGLLGHHSIIAMEFVIDVVVANEVLNLEWCLPTTIFSRAKNGGRIVERERGVEKLSDSLFAFFCWVTPYLLLLLLLLFPSFRSLSATGTDYYFPIKSKRAIYIFQRNSKPLSVSVSLKIKTP